jgi:hypothetical protein
MYVVSSAARPECARINHAGPHGMPEIFLIFLNLSNYRPAGIRLDHVAPSSTSAFRSGALPRLGEPATSTLARFRNPARASLGPEEGATKRQSQAPTLRGR